MSAHARLGVSAAHLGRARHSLRQVRGSRAQVEVLFVVPHARGDEDQTSPAWSAPTKSRSRDAARRSRFGRARALAQQLRQTPRGTARRGRCRALCAKQRRRWRRWPSSLLSPCQAPAYVEHLIARIGARPAGRGSSRPSPQPSRGRARRRAGPCSNPSNARARPRASSRSPARTANLFDGSLATRWPSARSRPPSA